jgi:hypothetical protein
MAVIACDAVSDDLKEKRDNANPKTNVTFFIIILIYLPR